MTHDTNTSGEARPAKYYWRTEQFDVGVPLQTRVTLCGPDFDTEEEAKLDAERNVKRITRNWRNSCGGTSKYTIKMGDPRDN
jgi:hypothetical protein